MRLIQTDEQKELASSVRRFLADTAPMARVRAVAESDEAYDRAVWDRMTGELGLAGLAIPEEYGGAGYGHAEVAVVLEELGAALTPSPYLGSVVVAANLLLQLGDEEAAKEFLPGIAAGRTVAALVVPGVGEPLPTASANHELTGSVARVLNGCDAGLLLVPALLDGEVMVYAVARDASGLARTRMTTLDLTRPLDHVSFSATPARPLARSEHALDRTLDLVSVLLAAEQLGGLRRCLDTIVAYAKVRVQFGRFVGSFQGVKHKLADMHCTLEQAEAIVRYATWTADEAPDELPVAAALAQSYLGPAYYQVAKDHLLLHGGIGFTWEHDAHLYYKRAKSAELLLGPNRRHRAALATRLGLVPQNT